METRLQKRQRTEPEPNIGYKKAKEGFIVKLEILGENNEKRTDIRDPVHAKYRCSKAKVLDIFHYKTNEKKESIGGIYNNNFIYKLNEIVETKFNPNLESVCSEGIHYFKTLKQANFWRFNLDNYIGEFMEWYENGSPYYKCYINNGRYEGKHEIFNEDGKLWKTYFVN